MDYRMFSDRVAAWEYAMAQMMEHFEVCSAARLRDYLDFQGFFTETLRYDPEERLYYLAYEAGEQDVNALLASYSVGQRAMLAAV